jgi:hypothetical protein
MKVPKHTQYEYGIENSYYKVIGKIIKESIYSGLQKTENKPSKKPQRGDTAQHRA